MGAEVACPEKLGASKTCIDSAGGLGRTLDGVLRASFSLVASVSMVCCTSRCAIFTLHRCWFQSLIGDTVH